MGLIPTSRAGQYNTYSGDGEQAKQHKAGVEDKKNAVLTHGDMQANKLDMPENNYLGLLSEDVPEGMEEHATAIRNAIQEVSTSDHIGHSISKKLTKAVYFPMEAFRKKNLQDTPFYIGATRAIIQLGVDKLVPAVDRLRQEYKQLGEAAKPDYTQELTDSYRALLSLTQYVIDDDSRTFLKQYEESWGKEVDDLSVEEHPSADDYKFTNSKTKDALISVGIYVALLIVIEVPCLCLGFYLTWPAILIASALFVPIKKLVGKRKNQGE